MPDYGRLVTRSPFDLDSSGEWLFWAEPPEEAFRESLAELGPLEPVLVAEDEDGPRLVAGYKRVLACRELDIPVLTLSLGHPDPVTRGRMYAASNRQRHVDAGDLVQAGRFFAKHLEQSALERQLAEIAGSQAGKRTPELVRTWLRLPPDWDGLLQRGHLPLQAAEILPRLGEEDTAALFPFFRDLRWSKNNARQFLTWLEEAASRERASIAELIRSRGLRDLLESDLSPKDRIHRLVQRTRELRYPRLTGLESEFEDLVRQAGPSGRWRISPVGSFESDRIQLSANVSTSEDLQGALQELERLEGALERIRQWQRSRLSGSEEKKK